MPLYLGLDAGAPGLTAIVIDIHDDRRQIVFEHTLSFDRDLPEYGATAATPVRWADALDRMLGRLAAAAEIDIEELRAISGSSPASVVEGGPFPGPGASPLQPSVALARQLVSPQNSIASLTAYLEGLLSAGTFRLGEYWQKRYALPAATLVPWAGDHESRVIGTGLIRDGVLGIAFGTNDTVSTTAGSLSFRNGALARDWIRMAYGLDWNMVARMLARSPGNDGCLMLPWLELEDTPRIAHAGLRRFGFNRHDPVHNVCGLIEGQLMAMATHAAGISDRPIERIVASGGAAANHAILQVMANIFGVDVYRLDSGNAAALGAALRAYHADRMASGQPASWPSVVSGFAEPKPGHRVSPNPRHVAIYRELRKDYAMLERLHRNRAPICS